MPRQTLDIDYDVRTPADAIDQYKADKGKNDPKYNTFEEYFVQERLLATQLMVAFRWDPYMMHQTNAFKFTYNDPTPNPHFNFGSSYDTSMVALWMQRVLGDMLSFYNLPSMSLSYFLPPSFPSSPPFGFVAYSFLYSCHQANG